MQKGESIRIVVADDIELIRNHISRLIDSQPDMEVVGTAFSGNDVQRIIDELNGDVDIVLMDVEMDTKNDGIVSAYVIHDKYPKIIVVFLTVHNDDDLVFDSFSAGGISYILKSSNDIELCDSIRMAYKKVSNIHPEIAQKLFKEFSRLRNNEPKLFEIMSILSNLTRSEREILKILAEGKKAKDITMIRQVELSTIKTQINNILKKFNAKSTKDVVNIISNLKLKNYINSLGE